MSIHILFKDGSNPYLKYSMNPVEFATELLSWSKNYDLSFIKVTSDSIFHFEATERGYNNA